MLDRIQLTVLISTILLAASYSPAQQVQEKQQVQENEPDINNGRVLFERDWVANKSLRTGGLGPLFNATSCAACHSQGGTGGGGDNRHNAQLLSILPAKNRFGKFDLSEQSIERMFEEGEKIHQDLANVNGMVLHRFGAIDTYADWRNQLLWGEVDSRVANRNNQMLDHMPIHRITRGIPSEKTRSGKSPESQITLQISQRNTPSLFGAGLIEAIPNEVLKEIVESQESVDDGIRGKVARIKSEFGKFGWRGQQGSLEKFTIQACAVELGLRTPTQPENDLPETLEIPENFSPRRGIDMTEKEIVDLVGFIRQLPPPLEKLPEEPKQLEAVKKGEIVFNRLNCAACHVKKVGELDGVYSDFLMHDMGPELADVSGVVSKSSREIRQSIGGYFGPSSTLPTETRTAVSVGTDSFWQTPPLWGIAQSAPYMHDGRAKNIQEAILAHGGEAEEAKQGFKRLTAKYRRYLLTYMETLGAIQE